MAKPAILTTATILAGGTLSGSVDLTQGSVAFVIGPSDWTDAEVSFQVSYDNISFWDLFDNKGYEVTRPVIPGVAVALSPELTQAARYLKVRSGSRTKFEAQEADRVFTLVLV